MLGDDGRGAACAVTPQPCGQARPASSYDTPACRLPSYARTSSSLGRSLGGMSLFQKAASSSPNSFLKVATLKADSSSAAAAAFSSAADRDVQAASRTGPGGSRSESERGRCPSLAPGFSASHPPLCALRRLQAPHPSFSPSVPTLPPQPAPAAPSSCSSPAAASCRVSTTSARSRMASRSSSYSAVRARSALAVSSCAGGRAGEGGRRKGEAGRSQEEEEGARQVIMLQPPFQCAYHP